LETVGTQLDSRLDFWINLIYADMAWDLYFDTLIKQGVEDDMQNLSYFVNTGFVDRDGNPKASLEIWESFRNGE